MSGPRVMRYGFAGGQNFFKEFAGQMGKTGEAEWQPRGGHRVWIAPEDPVKSYAPDNDAVAIAGAGRRDRVHRTRWKRSPGWRRRSR